VLISRPGTDKTHIATALGVQAVAHHCKKVRFFATVDLVNALEQEKAMNKAAQMADRLSNLDIVIFDELGYQPFGPSAYVPLALEALRADQLGHHHQPQLQRVGRRVRRCQDDNRAPRAPNAPLSHP
jgi:hypothetical protein